MAPSKNAQKVLKLHPTEWYSPEEAATFLPVKEETVKAYCRARKLKNAEKVGPRKEWRVRGTDIQDLLKAWNLTKPNAK